jgi:hypothetical protein
MEAEDARMRRLFFRVIVLSMAISYAAYFLAPQAVRKLMVGETSPAEILTSILALSAAVTGGRALLFRRGRRYPRPACMIPLFALFFFLEEISYGGIYFHFSYPQVQGYVLHSFHDLWPAYYRALVHGDAVLGYGILSAAMIAALPGVMVINRRYGKRLAAWFRDHPCYFYFAIALGLAVIAQVFDLDLWRLQIIRLTETLLEMNAAVALLFSAFAMYRMAANARQASQTCNRSSKPNAA